MGRICDSHCESYLQLTSQSMGDHIYFSDYILWGSTCLLSSLLLCAFACFL